MQQLQAPPETESFGPPPVTQRDDPGLTVRSAVIAIVLTVVCGLWVRQAEIIATSTNITESVPPIPAVTVLLALVALNPVLYVLGRRFALSRGEILAIYSFVGIAVSVLGVGVLRFWLSVITVPFALATPSNGLATLQPAMPGWLTPKQPGVIKGIYERSATGQVPWSAWVVPLLAWSAFFVALWVCMWCLMLLVRRRWLEGERLSFPIVQLPLEITAPTGQKGQPPFLRDPLMWLGFGLAAAYNISNIVHALAPSIPGPGKLYDFTPALQTPPWNAVGPVELAYRPELIGFGFLVPTQILFSIWFFWLLARAVALFSVMYARDVPGMPFEQEQAMGAYLLLGVWLLWQARHEITGSLRSAFQPRAASPNDSGPPRWAAWGMLASFAFLCCFCAAAGMATWVAIAYLGIVLLTALVTGRIRAEAGIPLIWLFPAFQQKKILLNTLGSAAFLSGSVPTTLTMLAMLAFLARGYFPSLIGCQIESLKLAGDARISRRGIGTMVLLAVPVGLIVGYYVHLVPYYRHGALYLGNGDIWGQWTAFQDYRDVLAAKGSPGRPDLPRTFASAAGAGITGALLLLRGRFAGFPLHPVGYAVATAAGSLVWFPFMVVWAVKSVLLRVGGMATYRRAIPFFLGLALGHFLVAGMVWGLLGALWPNVARVYTVWFG